MDKKLLPSRSSVTTRTTRFMLKCPLRYILRVQGCHHPSYVMVWWEVSHQGVTPSFLQERGETGVRVYQEDVLQEVVKHLNMTLFSGQEWVFQQDSIPAHKPKLTQEWLQRNVPPFISAEDWPSGSPDLYPRDYKLLPALEDKACQSITTTWTV
jgi:hypothetical protein